ncbi:MBL fold metallo-hydrolase [Anaeropeptidivorans aminofermentans]|uniref:MBL fold metallo-hydrolase n=1 Tax=Anaeropeptidivorans aminofermentans TaxID=2934315 RepID=UPI002024F263|nr:MBL fold metallo-hydrolase [Anaeropeptidivorans aminofermentans]
MKVINVPVSTMFVNAYIYYDENTKEAVLIDPGKDEDKLIHALNENGLVLKAILLTHGHFDHISAVNEVIAKINVPVYAHEDEIDFLLDPMENESKRLGWHAVSVKTDVVLKEGDIVKVGEGELKVIHTPGHTKGGVCYYDEKNGILFSGDSLFFESVGRSDFPYGDGKALVENLKKKIAVLPEDVKVLPGHGRATTIGHEKKMNFFLREQ